MNNKSKRAIIAHHEAGHAVIAHKLGCKVHRVAIDADSGGTVITFGKRLSGDEPFGKRLGGDERAILANLAGPYAQKRFASRPDGGATTVEEAGIAVTTSTTSPN